MFPPYLTIDHLEERTTDDPQLLAVFPWNDTDVPVSSYIHLHFSGKSAPLVCKIWVNATLAYEHGVGFDPDYSGPKSTANTTTSAGYGAPNGLRVLIDKTVNFLSAQPVTVTYLYEDNTGRTLSGEFQFTCTDTTLPTLDSVVLGKGSAKEIVLTFSEPLASIDLTIVSMDGFVPAIASTTIAGAIVYVKLADELSFQATYYLRAYVTDLAGNTTPPLMPITADVTTEDYHIDCRDKMPQYWLDKFDDDGNLRKLCNLFSEVLSLSFKDTDYYRLMWDYDECYDEHVDRMIESFGAEGLLTEFVSKRKLLSVLFEIYRRKGIKVDLAGVIRTLVGVAPKIEEWYEDRFRIGYSKLNGTDRLIGDRTLDPFHFRVIFEASWRKNRFRIGYSKLDGPDSLIGDIAVDPSLDDDDGSLTDAQRKTVERIVKAIKPANTTFTIVEPSETITYWRIGHSKLNGPHRLC